MVLSANPVKFQLLTINTRNVDTDNYNQDISVDGHVIEREKGGNKAFRGSN